MPQFKAQAPQGREESPEEKAAWLALRSHIEEEEALAEGQTFALMGKITAIKGDPTDDKGETPLWKEITDRKTGEKKKQPHLTVYVRLDDPRFAPIQFRKDIRISFFDGRMRGQDTRSPFRGGWYYIHRAATGFEPSPGLVNGTASFDPEEYVNVPLQVVLLYQGKVEKDSQYYGRTANITVFLERFEPTKETVRKANRLQNGEAGGGVEDESPFATVPATGPSSGTSAGKNSAPQQAALPVSQEDRDVDMANSLGISLADLVELREKREAVKQRQLGDELGLPV